MKQSLVSEFAEWRHSRLVRAHLNCAEQHAEAAHNESVDGWQQMAEQMEEVDEQQQADGVQQGVVQTMLAQTSTTGEVNLATEQQVDGQDQQYGERGISGAFVVIIYCAMVGHNLL